MLLNIIGPQISPQNPQIFPQIPPLGIQSNGGGGGGGGDIDRKNNNNEGFLLHCKCQIGVCVSQVPHSESHQT